MIQQRRRCFHLTTRRDIHRLTRWRRACRRAGAYAGRPPLWYAAPCSRLLDGASRRARASTALATWWFRHGRPGLAQPCCSYHMARPHRMPWPACRQRSRAHWWLQEGAARHLQRACSRPRGAAGALQTALACRPRARRGWVLAVSWPPAWRRGRAITDASGCETPRATLARPSSVEVHLPYPASSTADLISRMCIRSSSQRGAGP